jgi:hypothetical protein
MPNAGWLKWLNKELSSKGFKVFAPNMPDKENPKIDAWVNFLKKIVGKADKDTYFIGHSIGCQAILRYLESQDNKVGGIIFVGGWFKVKGLESKEEEEIASPWVNTPINLEKVRKKINKIVSIVSDDDPFVSLENSKIFKERLGAKIIIEKGKRHYIENVTKQIPAVLKEFLEMSKQK